jgi:large subunit ribosomal protein L16
LKRSMKKSDKTRRQMWFNAFPHLPLSKKPTGLRMGKGKGKLSCWFTNIRGGIVLVEFKNLRLGRSLYYIKQLQHKLGTSVTILKSSNSDLFLDLPFLKNKKTISKSFW